MPLKLSNVTAFVQIRVFVQCYIEVNKKVTIKWWSIGILLSHHHEGSKEFKNIRAPVEVAATQSRSE